MRHLIKCAYEQQPFGDTASLENPAAMDAIMAIGGERSDQRDWETVR
jgi:hypothetical protein